MPADEVEVQPPSKAKGKKNRPAKSAGSTVTRKKNLEAQPVQPVHTVTSSNDDVALPPTSYKPELQTDLSTTNGQKNSATTTSSVVSAASPVVQINNSHLQVNTMPH